jgi:hypothetical protein
MPDLNITHPDPLGQGFLVPDHLDIDPTAGGAAGLPGFPCRAGYRERFAVTVHPRLQNWADTGHTCGHFLGISGMLGP